MLQLHLPPPLPAQRQYFRRNCRHHEQCQLPLRLILPKGTWCVAGWPSRSPCTQTRNPGTVRCPQIFITKAKDGREIEKTKHRCLVRMKVDVAALACSEDLSRPSPPPPTATTTTTITTTTITTATAGLLYVQYYVVYASRFPRSWSSLTFRITAVVCL